MQFSPGRSWCLCGFSSFPIFSVSRAVVLFTCLFVVLRILSVQVSLVFITVFSNARFTTCCRLLKPVEHWRLTVLWMQLVLLDVIWRHMRKALRKENCSHCQEILYVVSGDVLWSEQTCGWNLSRQKLNKRCVLFFTFRQSLVVLNLVQHQSLLAHQWHNF